MEVSRVSEAPLDTAPRSIFFRLSAELRNHIYELAFTTATASETEIPLVTAAGPSKALLLTCRQVYDEARGLHKLAYRAYWETSQFEMRCSAETESDHILTNDERDLDAITNIIIRFTTATGIKPLIAQHDQSNGPSWNFMVPSPSKVQPASRRLAIRHRGEGVVFVWSEDQLLEGVELKMSEQLKS